jgi:hypothetical protein
MKEIKNLISLTEKESEEITGGLAPLIPIGIKVFSYFAGGFAIGYGWGSYDCDCRENDGRRLDEVGPTHYRA